MDAGNNSETMTLRIDISRATLSTSTATIAEGEGRIVPSKIQLMDKEIETLLAAYFSVVFTVQALPSLSVFGTVCC